jgi:hypothetical protein
MSFHKYVLALSIMTLCAASAHGASLFLDNVSPSANMTVTFPGLAPETTPYVGPINWSFDRGNPDNAGLDALVSGSTLTTFCIEGTQNVYLQQNSTFNSILNNLADAPQDNLGSIYQMGANALVLSKFWDAYYSQAFLSSKNAAAFQLGVWEIVYDGGITPNFAADDFQASPVAGDSTSFDALAQAQGWLSNLPNVTPTQHYQLYVLSDPCLQDQLFSVPVPLPAAFPVGVALLSAMAGITALRRRWVCKAATD